MKVTNKNREAVEKLKAVIEEGSTILFIRMPGSNGWTSRYQIHVVKVKNNERGVPLPHFLEITSYMAKAFGYRISTHGEMLAKGGNTPLDFV